ncbi:MAG: formylglycine-generating enzyme family protein [Bacteroidota bacterium]
MDIHKPYTEQLPQGPSFEMMWIEEGEFIMGGSDSEADWDEKPVHQVSLKSFYLGKYPVTQALWEAIMGGNPSSFKGADRPVEQVSWEDTQDFLQKLNTLTSKTYRLPSEAEWEYAARGGNHSEGYLYAGSDRLEQVGWYSKNSDGWTQPVGQKLGNELGIYDMCGNVSEWVEDQWHNRYEGAPTDGTAWVDREEGAPRVRRGGSWRNRAQYCRVSFRHHDSPGDRYGTLGFRLALALQSGG